jgi:hypothetical protein
MKIALCLSGFMRTFEETFPNLQKYLLSQYNIDIFIYTWDIQDGHLPHIKISKDKLSIKYKTDNIVVNKFMPLTQISHEKSYDKNRNVNNVFSMYNNIYQCNKLKSTFEDNNNFKYDCVIRMRPDINLKELLLINNLSLDIINIPRSGDFGGINDQCAYSNSENMNEYSSLILDINRYMQDDKFISPEILMQYHLKQKNMVINRFTLDYDLLCHNSILNNKKRDDNFDSNEYLAKLGFIKTKENDIIKIKEF